MQAPDVKILVSLFILRLFFCPFIIIVRELSYYEKKCGLKLFNADTVISINNLIIL